jgi:hypothetical protein
MSQPSHPALETWLAEATRGLSGPAATLARAELAAHFEDAVDEYLAAGLTPAEATGRALRDLGAPDMTSDGFNDVHRGRRHYQIAAGISLLNVFIIFGLPWVLESIGVGSSPLVFTVAYLARVITMGYVLWTLRRLLIWRLHARSLDRPFVLLIGGIAGETLAAVLSQLVLGNALAVDSNFVLSDATSVFQVIVVLLVIVSRVAAGAGALELGWRLLRVDREQLYGLSLPLAGLALAMGVALPGMSLLAHLGAMTLTMLAMVVILLVHALIWPLLTLVFFRAVVHPAPSAPAQLA